ncbi:MAG: DUF4410 domain-containing protein [Calditrichaceae bacterium]
MHRSLFFKLIMAWILVGFAAGCASTDGQPLKPVVDERLPRPTTVLIADFASDTSEISQSASLLSHIEKGIRDNTHTAEEIQLAKEVADALAGELAAKIASMGLNPVRVPPDTKISRDSILITGNFVSIDEGNRRRRNLIGLGAGKSSLDCTAGIFTVEGSGVRQLTAFDAQVDSRRIPGVAVMGPAGKAAGAGTGAIVSSNLAMSGLKSYHSASVQLAKGLAENIAVEVGKILSQAGLDSSRYRPVNCRELDHKNPKPDLFLHDDIHPSGQQFSAIRNRIGNTG